MEERSDPKHHPVKKPGYAGSFEAHKRGGTEPFSCSCHTLHYRHEDVTVNSTVFRGRVPWPAAISNAARQEFDSQSIVVHTHNPSSVRNLDTFKTHFRHILT